MDCGKFATYDQLREVDRQALYELVDAQPTLRWWLKARTDPTLETLIRLSEFQYLRLTALAAGLSKEMPLHTIRASRSGWRPHA
jgi:hypothetical protein